nr:aldehyde dehydrogenase family protein [Arthrobacter cupressi]
MRPARHPLWCITTPTLEAAAKGVRSAGFWNGGQECDAACRVLVHESVAEKFTDCWSARSARSRSAPPARPFAVRPAPAGLRHRLGQHAPGDRQ